MIPVIYKGDDTNFRGRANLAIRVNTDIDLTGCRVEFVFLNQKRTFTGSADMATLPFIFTAAETATMPVGIHKAKIRVFDTEGRVRTVDEPKIKVTDDLREAYPGEDEQEIEVTIGNDGDKFTQEDVFDCSAGSTELKERIAYLWEKMGGKVINRPSLDYGGETPQGEGEETGGGGLGDI